MVVSASVFMVPYLSLSVPLLQCGLSLDPWKNKEGLRDNASSRATTAEGVVRY